MEPWQNDPIATPQAAPSPANAEAWQNDPVAQPAPKAPDVSGVQKMAQDNLSNAANDNKSTDGVPKPPPTPMDNLKTASGLPVDKIINGTAKPTDVNAANRVQYVKALDNGSATNSSDWHQTLFNAIGDVTPIIAGMASRAAHPIDALEEGAQDVGSAFKSGGGAIYPFYSTEQMQEQAQEFKEGLTPYKNPASPQPTELARRAIEMEQGTVGEVIGGLYAPLAILSPVISPIIQSTGGKPAKPGEIPTWQNLIPGALGVGMDVAGGMGLYHGATALREAAAAKLGKDPAAVSPSDINQLVADGSKNLHPSQSEFKTAATATGVSEKGFKTVYADARVTPEKIITDAQQNPAILADVVAGKVPEQYEYMVEPKAALPMQQADGLHIVRDEATKSFSVVDRDGDHLQGGFDSYEEAQQHIEDRRFDAEERAALENEERLHPELATEKTEAGEQQVIPGAGGSGEQLAAAHEGRRLGADVAQKAVGSDGGLFDSGEGKTADIFDQPVKAQKSPFEQRPAQREIPKDNYSKNLSEYSPVMFREASPGAALELLPHGGVISDVDELHLADTVDMALGQNANKGVLIAFDTDGLKGARNTSKPMLEHSFTQGMGEYLGKRNKQADYQKAVSAIRIDKDTPLSGVNGRMLKRTLKTLEEKGWTKTETDKYTEYKKPSQEKVAEPVKSEPPETVVTPKPKIQGVIPPSEKGKVTTLNSFLRNNGAKFDKDGELISMKDAATGQVRKGDDALDHAGLISQQAGYFRERPLVNEIQDKIREGGHTREADVERVQKSQDNAQAKQMNDPAYLEHEAHNVGIDTERTAGETDKQFVKRLHDALEKFYSEQGGAVPVNLYRKTLGNIIIATEKFTGKLTGGLFDKVAESYKSTFQPELFGDMAKRADAYLAKYKASMQEAQNAFYRQFAADIRRGDRLSKDEQLKAIDDYETGRWNEEENPQNALYESLLDKTFQDEKEAIGADPDKGYKENYLPLQFKDPVKAKAFFDSPAMIKKYGADWFTKPRSFNMIQDAVRAGLELKTYNMARMVVSRLLAGDSMVRTMDLLHDLEGSGAAVRSRAFSVDKRIAKTNQAITDLETKYKKDLENIEKQASLKDEQGKPIGEPISKKMQVVQKRLANLKERLDDFKNEKSSIKSTPEQLKELKGGFRIIGPDSKAWNIHPQAAPVWKNAMELKGLWENQGLSGDAYRRYMGAKAIYVRAKMMASLFHPSHEAVIDISSGMASVAHHLVQGGKISDLTVRDIPGRMGLTGNTFKFLKGEMPKDHPKIVSWNTAPDARTPEQQADVKRMTEGGFVPTISAKQTVRVKENFDKAISGIGMQNLRLLGTAIEATGLPMVPFMEHWIPGMKADSYFQRTDFALKRDPSLATDPGKRCEVFRQIAQDIERNYGEMNRNTQFWNPVMKDIFNATTFSGGWKLAMLQNMRGLAEPASIAYKWAKTGDFSKADVTHQMLQSYIYTANMLAVGAGLTYLFTGAVGTVKDWMNPPTGDKNPDGTPVRLRPPAFFNEPMMLLRDINEKGAVEGTGSFFMHQTLIPGIADSLAGQDFVGRPYITDPTDLQQWKNMGWDSITPITLSNTEQAEGHGSKTAETMGWLGFPMAGKWVNESPFEQKVTAKYFEQNPSKDSALQAKLKAEMHGAIIDHDSEKQKEIEGKMKAEHMSQQQINSSERHYTDKFSTYAWSKLSAEDQKHIIGSASEEERRTFKVKND